MTRASKKIYIISSACALGIVLFVALVIVPLIRQISIDSQMLYQKKQIVDSFFQNWQNLENSKNNYDEIEKALQNKTVLLTSDEAIKFILAVEDSARATQNYQTISVLEKTPTADVQSKTQKRNTIDFQISLWGSFPNLIKFLIYLENAPYYNNISSLQINRLIANDVETLKNTVNLSVGDINSIITLSVYQPDETSTQ
jgi:hypothetical protein